MSDRSHGAILVLPSSASGQLGPVASWVSTAGWAGAIRRIVGDAWVVTPDGEIDVEELRSRATTSSRASDGGKSWRRRLPVPVKTAVKDAREWRRARSFRIDPSPWRRFDVQFVWQRHELFHDAGLELARELAAPAVLFVPATLVWQAEQWQVKRHGWGRFLEERGEGLILRRADVVAAGSDIVAEQLARLGVDEERITITRTGFDPDVFTGVADGHAIRERLEIDDRFVVGWIGSFRRFHAVDQLVEAVAAMSSRAPLAPVLLLVGDGPEHARVIDVARARGVRVVSTGTVPHTELPALIAAMDVAVLIAAKGTEFHYSPLKLAEYLASGVAVVAPRAGRVPTEVTDRVDVVLVEPGDIRGLARELDRLRASPGERSRLAVSARAAALDRFSWDHAVREVLVVLERHGAAQGTAGRLRRDSRRHKMS